MLKKAEVFGFEVGGEDAFAYGIEDLPAAPEPAACQLVGAGVHRAVIDGAEHINELFLDLAFEHVMSHIHDIGHTDAQLLHDFTLKCLLHGLAVRYMPAHRGVPFSGLYGLPVGPALQIELAARVEKVQMNHRMQHFAAVMRLAAQYLAQHAAILVDYGKKFVIIIRIHKVPWQNLFKRNGALLKRIGVLQHGELGAEPLQTLHVQLGADHLLAFIGLNKHIAVRADDSAVAGVVAPLIGPGAVYADGKALVLDGAGTQQGVPGQDAFLGPVGGYLPA